MTGQANTGERRRSLRRLTGVIGPLPRLRRPLAVGLLAMVGVIGPAACAPDPPHSAPRMSVSPAIEAEFSLYTHCGIDEVQYDEIYFERVGGPLTDGQGNPPAGWGNPYQQGWVTRNGNLLTFTDKAGHAEQFQARPGAAGFKHICS